MRNVHFGILLLTVVQGNIDLNVVLCRVIERRPGIVVASENLLTDDVATCEPGSGRPSLTFTRYRRLLTPPHSGMIQTPPYPSFVIITGNHYSF